MYALARPVLFSMPPAWAHELAMASLGIVEHLPPVRDALAEAFVVDDERLRVHKMGLVFPNPIGLAGGFDKNARRPLALAALGFGFLELGTVTGEPQHANPAPNMFRLPADRALINRLGFPNEGAARVAARLRAKIGTRKQRRNIAIPVGVSIGKSRSVALDPFEGAIADYMKSFEAVADVADFVVVNVSSPNTKDLRAMQGADMARALLRALVAKRDAVSDEVPILVKVAPDLADDDLDALFDVANECGCDGVVATNTTIVRSGLTTPAAEVEQIGAGGLSGPPLHRRALDVVARARRRLGTEKTIIGVGGIEGLVEARAMLEAGADLLQVYTGFIYGGPSFIKKTLLGLSEPGRR